MRIDEIVSSFFLKKTNTFKGYAKVYVIANSI